MRRIARLAGIALLGLGLFAGGGTPALAKGKAPDWSKFSEEEKEKRRAKTKELLADLDKPRPKYNREVNAVLAKIVENGDPDALPHLVNMLRKACTFETRAKKDWGTVLADQEAEKAAGLRPDITGGGALRNAISALGKDRKRLSELVMPLINDPEPRVRGNVMRDMTLLKGIDGAFHKRAFELLDDESVIVRRSALCLLWHMCSDVPPRRTENPEPWKWYGGKVYAPGLTERLIKIWHEDVKAIRLELCHGLVEAGFRYPHVREAAFKRLREDEEAHVRAYLAREIASNGRDSLGGDISPEQGKEVVAELKDILAGEKDATVRKELEATIGAWEDTLAGKPKRGGGRKKRERKD